MIRRSVLIVAALVLVGGFAACGGGKGGDSGATNRGEESGDDAGSGSTEPGQIGEAATADRPASSDPAGTQSSDGAASEDAAPTGVPGDIGNAFETDYTFTGEGGEQFCSQMADLQSQYAEADPASISLTELADKMEAIAPPPELASDWPGYIEMQRALAAPDGNGDLPDEDSDEVAAFASASAKVSVYLTDVCGL